MVESTTEAKTAKAEGEPGPMCVGFWQGWELQELGQALLDALVMGNGEGAGQVRTQPAHGVEGPRGCTVEKQEPTGLACSLVRSAWMYSSVPMGRPRARRPR